VCCSQAELDEGRAVRVRGEAVVVPNAVDLARYRPGGDEERTAARARLHLGTEPLVVCVGRLSPQKGQDLLLDAWPAVLSEVPTARLLLVGDGPDLDVLRRREVTGVHFAGHREDVADWLLAADVVALPSRYEGMALTLLEAMATARSVVAHDVAGMAEALAPPGRPPGGGLVRAKDGPGLAAAIAARLRDPDQAAAEGRAGRRIVEDNHDLKAWSERLCTLTEELADR
jgi:glycosyltransferase involved in cell wall biosynthesis